MIQSLYDLSPYRHRGYMAKRVQYSNHLSWKDLIINWDRFSKTENLICKCSLLFYYSAQRYYTFQGGKVRLFIVSSVNGNTEFLFKRAFLQSCIFSHTHLNPVLLCSVWFMWEFLWSYLLCLLPAGVCRCLPTRSSLTVYCSKSTFPGSKISCKSTAGYAMQDNDASSTVDA